MFRDRRVLRLFFRSFIITMVAAGVLVAAGWFVIHNIMGYISAPEVPGIPVFAEGVGEDGQPLPPVLVGYEVRRPDFYTFLILGLAGQHADAIMVGAYCYRTQQGYIISIPRDTRVDVQRGRRKIVQAYASGRGGGGGHEGGIARMKDEVATLLGFRPDFYISINFTAFTRMVDAVGGVTIDVPFHMLYDDPAQNLHINIPAGRQHLDGADALRFARFRLGNDRRTSISDYQRIEHQQMVIAAVVQELITPASILRIPEFIDIFTTYVQSDLNAGQLLWFANQARNVSGTDSLHMYTIPTLGTSGAPAWYELPDGAGIIELVNRTVNPMRRDVTAADLRIAP